MLAWYIAKVATSINVAILKLRGTLWLCPPLGITDIFLCHLKIQKNLGCKHLQLCLSSSNLHDLGRRKRWEMTFSTWLQILKRSYNLIIMRTFRRVLSSINYLFPKLLTLDPSGAAAATMLVHGLLILAELLNWYVFYIPDWVFGAQMKVRTFALVIDWKKIDSRSGVQLGDNSQSSLGRKDPALFFFPRFLAKVTPTECCHIFGLVVAFFWHSKSLFENLSFSFPDSFVAELETVVPWMLSFPLCLCLVIAPAFVVLQETLLGGTSIEKQVITPQVFSTFVGSKRGEERVMEKYHCFSSQPQDVSYKVTFQGRVSVVLNICSSVSENKSLSKGHSRGSSGMPESDSKIYQIAVPNKFKLKARALYCLIIALSFAIWSRPSVHQLLQMPLVFCDLCSRNLSFLVACINRNIKMA